MRSICDKPLLRMLFFTKEVCLCFKASSSSGYIFWSYNRPKYCGYEYDTQNKSNLTESEYSKRAVFWTPRCKIKVVLAK
jgi:hypothetical protein